MTPTTAPLALSLTDCAALSPFSEKQIRQAVKATDEASWPPPLKAKVTSRNADGSPRQYVVLRKEFERWLDNLPDA